MRILRFVCSGAIGISVNLGTLHLLAGVFGYHYLISSIIAVSISTVVGFLLQKYWTFAERSVEKAGEQFALYVVVAVTNIGVNTLIVFLLSGVYGFHYLFAQFVGAGVVATMSYLIYKGLIFRSAHAPAPMA